MDRGGGRAAAAAKATGGAPTPSAVWGADWGRREKKKRAKKKYTGCRVRRAPRAHAGPRTGGGGRGGESTNAIPRPARHRGSWRTRPHNNKNHSPAHPTQRRRIPARQLPPPIPRGRRADGAAEGRGGASAHPLARAQRVPARQHPLQPPRCPTRPTHPPHHPSQQIIASDRRRGRRPVPAPPPASPPQLLLLPPLPPLPPPPPTTAEVAT